MKVSGEQLEELRRMLAGEEKRAFVHLRMLDAHVRAAADYLTGDSRPFGLGPGQTVTHCASDLVATMARVDAFRLAIKACEAKT